MGHGRTVKRAGYVVQCFHIADHSPHLERNAPFRNSTPQRFVHKDVLVPGGVEVHKFKGFKPAGRSTGHGRAYRLHGTGMLALEADDALFRAGTVHHGFKTADHGVHIAFHKVRITHEQRLARGSVHQNRVHRGVGLDMRGQARASCAYNSGFPYVVNNLISHHTVLWL